MKTIEEGIPTSKYWQASPTLSKLHLQWHWAVVQFVPAATGEIPVMHAPAPLQRTPVSPRGQSGDSTEG